MSSEEVKQKIVLSAIECLERYGRTGVTIRKIAVRAGVNSAAISYYFGGQENLMDIVMRQTLANAFTVSEHVEHETKDMKSYLKAVFAFLIEGATKWPNISKAHFYDIYTDADYDSPATDTINTFLNEVYLKVKDKTNLHEETLKRRLLILMSQMVYFTVSPRLLQDFLCVSDPKKFICDLIDDMFLEEA